MRDILVGKVPDPKAQVEQITIALIYKFMDDMDLQGVEFGGSRVFFTGEYEKYAFSQIMLAEHSAQDKLNLYAEGMDKMVENPDLPKLFRDAGLFAQKPDGNLPDAPKTNPNDKKSDKKKAKEEKIPYFRASVQPKTKNIYNTRKY